MAEVLLVSLILRSYVAIVREFKLSPCRNGARCRVVQRGAHTGLASDTITNGADVVAPMYWSIGINTELGSRISTAKTAHPISLANGLREWAGLRECAWSRLRMVLVDLFLYGGYLLTPLYFLFFLIM